MDLMGENDLDRFLANGDTTGQIEFLKFCAKEKKSPSEESLANYKRNVLYHRHTAGIAKALVDTMDWGEVKRLLNLAMDLKHTLMDEYPRCSAVIAFDEWLKEHRLEEYV